MISRKWGKKLQTKTYQVFVAEMAEVTTEEIIQIANSFLLAAPPGEFMEVVTGKY